MRPRLGTVRRVGPRKVQENAREGSPAEAWVSERVSRSDDSIRDPVTLLVTPPE
jgi:hypothetical protein